MNSLTPPRIPGAGHDAAPERRPGVPMETSPEPVGNAHWDRPEPMKPRPGILKRANLEKFTPVFGTAQPIRGVSGALRRLGYSIPEHKVRHWAVLLLADRVDVLESKLGRLLPFVAPLAAVAAFALLRRRPRRRFLFG